MIWKLLMENCCLADDVLLRFQSSIFASVAVARETAPNEALVALYDCTVVYLRIIPLTDEVLQQSEEIIRNSWNTIKTEPVHRSFLRLLDVFAETDWMRVRNVISEKAGSSKTGDFPMLCAAVHDVQSYADLSSIIFSNLTENPNREFFDIFLLMTTKLTSACAIPVSSIAEQFYSIAFKLMSPTDETIAAFAETMQSLGLLLDDESRHLLLVKIVDTLTSSEIMDMFCLFLLQSQDSTLMQSCVLLPICSKQTAYKLCIGIANHDPDVEKVLALGKILPYEISYAISKGLLLCGREEGIEIFEELLYRLWRSDSTDREILFNHLCEMFDYDTAANNPQRCLFKVTFLWKQRILNQLSKSYITVMNDADDAGKSVLMRLLPTILKSSENNPAVQQLFDEFLPVFRTALAGDKVVDPVVLLALPRFIAGSPADKFSPEDSQCMVEVLARTLMASNIPMSTMISCLESLELVAHRMFKYLSTATIALVIAATVPALGHKKRIVRQKAGVVRNLWEAKRL